MFCFFPAIFMSSTYTDKNNPLFHGVRISIRNKEPSPNRVAIGFSQLAFPIMVLAICVVVDESKCLDIPILEFSIIWEHPPFYLGISRYCVSCLSCATRQSGDDIHDFCCCQFVMLMILVQKILRMTPNRRLQYHLGVQLDLRIFGALPPIRHSSNDICPSVRRNELFHPSSLLHRLPLSYF